jgi:hypothetical protein
MHGSPENTFKPRARSGQGKRLEPSAAWLSSVRLPCYLPFPLSRAAIVWVAVPALQRDALSSARRREIFSKEPLSARGSGYAGRRGTRFRRTGRCP